MQAKWTEQILDEVFTNLRANPPRPRPDRTGRTRALMNAAVRDCIVTGYEPLIDGISLPDPGDRHGLSAAIRARAQIIVTNNLADFPADPLQTWDIEAKSPDEFDRLVQSAAALRA